MMRLVTGKPLTVSEMARLGGKARAQKLSKEERSASARKAVQARWAKLKKLADQIDEQTKSLEAKAKRRKKK